VFHLILPAQKLPLPILALVAASLTGWGGFAYSALSASGVRAERDEALAQHQQLKDATGDLSQVVAKLSATRIEYGRAVQGWAEARARLGATQQELAALTKRVEQAKDRVTETGSIRPAPAASPAKPAPRKP
jgi:hypothetical protein